MLNRKAQKIVASLLVIGALAGIGGPAVSEASFKKEQQRPGKKIEYRYDQKDYKKWDKKVNLKEQRNYMKKARQIVQSRNIHIPSNHWIYSQRVPKKVMVKYVNSNRYQHWERDNDNNELLLGLILGAILAEAADNN
ncbi:MAG: hypothetical protein GX568_03290 [Candidatus Gastranaerophilales bacterium]|nr:hypothetical protein [Candidatus Gastranaerophilales bacterium]